MNRDIVSSGEMLQIFGLSSAGEVKEIIRKLPNGPYMVFEEVHGSISSIDKDYY